MGNGDIHPWTIGQEQVMNSIAGSLRMIANCMEAEEKRKRSLEEGINPDSLGALALWRWEVQEGNTRLGWSEWLAWHTHDESTTPEDIENMGAAVQAVKRGFADMEAQVQAQKEKGDA